MSDGDVSWVLLPGFPVYLHGGGVQQLDPHLCGLPDPMGLAQSHLKNLDIWRGVWGGGEREREARERVVNGNKKKLLQFPPMIIFL